MKYLGLLSCLLVACLNADARAGAGDVKLELKDGDRVAFIGNTFVEREANDCYIETMLTSRFPDRNITFRNLGYSADTVTGSARGLCTGWATFEAPDQAFDRLRKLVAEFKPTVLLMNYGMTESFSGPEGIPQFVANYNKMLDALIAAAGTSPRIVLMSPNYHEDLGRPLPDPSEHNKNLELYSKSISSIASQRGFAFIDLLLTTRAYASSHAAGARPLTSNGIHLQPIGYWEVADALSTWFQIDNGILDKGWSTKITVGGKIEATNAKVSNEQTGADLIRFVQTLNHLPMSPCPVEPAPLFNPETPGRLTIIGLKPTGTYELKANGKAITTATAELWSRGVTIIAGPDVEQAEALRKLIVAKNFDYFNYQRPDNDAYILAFRRGEQGRNAPEIPKFLPLVEAKEKQIAELRVPKPVTYTLEAVK